MTTYKFRLRRTETAEIEVEAESPGEAEEQLWDTIEFRCTELDELTWDRHMDLFIL